MMCLHSNPLEKTLKLLGRELSIGNKRGLQFQLTLPPHSSAPFRTLCDGVVALTALLHIFFLNFAQGVREEDGLTVTVLKS